MSFMKPTPKRERLGVERQKLMFKRDKTHAETMVHLGIIVERYAKQLRNAKKTEKYPQVAEKFEREFRGWKAEHEQTLDEIDTELEIVNEQIKVMASAGL